MRLDDAGFFFGQLFVGRLELDEDLRVLFFPLDDLVEDAGLDCGVEAVFW